MPRHADVTFEVVAISTRCGKQDVVSPWTRPNSLLGLGPLQDRTTSLIASTARASKTPPGLVHRTNLLGPEYGFGNDFVLLDETYLGAYGRVCHQYQILEPTAGASAPRRLTPWPNNPPTPRLMPSTPARRGRRVRARDPTTTGRRRRRDGHFDKLLRYHHIPHSVSRCFS